MCIFINTLSITYSVYIMFLYVYCMYYIPKYIKCNLVSIMFLYVCCVYIFKYIKYNLFSLYNATLCDHLEMDN